MVKYTVRTLFLIFFPIVMAVAGVLIGYLVFSAFDAITGLTWLLIFGVAGLVGELIINGLLSKKRNQWIAGIAVGALVFSMIGYLMYIGVLGSIFGPPPAPPPEFATGYSRIYLLDGMTGEFVGSSEIDLMFAENLSVWETDQATGVTFFVPNGSIYWVNVSGYYPASDTLFASGGDDPNDYFNNTLLIFRQAYPENITAQILRFQDISTSIYNYSGFLPDYDGVYELEIRVSINMPSRNTSMYGYASWLPDYNITVDSFADKLNLTFTTLWFGWNATLHEYTILNSQFWSFNDVYELDTVGLNCTMLPATSYDTTYTIIGNFSNIYDLRIYDLTIDNYDNFSVKLI